MESLFTEIRSEHIDDKGVVHIDGYRSTDEDAAGEVIAYIIKAEVYWRDPEFQFDHYVKEVVAEVIAEQQKEQDSLKEKITKAVTGVYYTPDAKPRPEFRGGKAEDKVSLINLGVEDILRLV